MSKRFRPRSRYSKREFIDYADELRAEHPYLFD